MSTAEVLKAIQSLYELYPKCSVLELVTEMDTLRVIVNAGSGYHYELVWYNEGWQL